jgi:GNAT superfamily N-acetyltransferase
MIEVAPLADGDRLAWGRLAAGYKAFYNTPTSQAEYDAAWGRLRSNDGVHGLGARLDGQLAGIVHYLFHTSTWTPCVCYLQDLYTEPARRSRGVARALIEGVAHSARARGATRLYWLTQEGNASARALYERVAQYRGFIRYDYPLG